MVNRLDEGRRQLVGLRRGQLQRIQVHVQRPLSGKLLLPDVPGLVGFRFDEVPVRRLQPGVDEPLDHPRLPVYLEVGTRAQRTRQVQPVPLEFIEELRITGGCIGRRLFEQVVGLQCGVCHDFRGAARVQRQALAIVDAHGP